MTEIEHHVSILFAHAVQHNRLSHHFSDRIMKNKNNESCTKGSCDLACRTGCLVFSSIGTDFSPCHIRTNSGPTRLELKQFSILQRSVPKIVLSLSKGEQA